MSEAIPASQSSLRHIIRIQLMRMSALMLALAVLVGFAWHFVSQGILANVYLNGGIIAVFGFGCVLAFRRVLLIRNDATAFEALQEAFEDARRERTEVIDDPYWRHYRSLEPGVVFGSPKSIGHMFELTYDELLRAKGLNLSVATLQNVIDAVENRLVDERSQVNYLTGLLIFLGLIGTFIGLMEMVGSVGDIIAGLAANGGSSKTAMKTLLSRLQVPLTGMATGFSSSLFGLFGSLVLGLLSRFGSEALGSLKEAFSAWLAAASHLEGGRGGDAVDLARLIADNLTGAGAGGGGDGRPNLGTQGTITDVGVVATIAQGFGRLNQSVDSLHTMAPRMADTQTEQTALLRAMLVNMDRMVADGSEMREQIGSLVATQSTMAEYLQEMINLQRTTETRLTSGFNGMAHIMEVTGQAYLDGLRRLTAENYETNARLAKLLDVKAAGDKVTEIAIGIEAKVKNGFGGLAQVLERTAMSIDGSMQRLAADQAELKELLAGRAGADARVGLSPEFEDRLTNGFAEVSRSFETVFAAYSTILNRTLMSQAVSAAEAGPAPVAIPVAPGTALPEHEPRPQPRDVAVDHDALRRRLYSAAANRQTSA